MNRSSKKTENQSCQAEAGYIIPHMDYAFFGFSIVCLLVSILVISPTMAQERVEVETDVFSIESEMELEDLLKAHQSENRSAEVKTRLEKQEDVMTDEPKPEPELEVAPKDRGIEETIQPELLSAQRRAVRADVIGEEEVVRINKSLRRAIEQNRRLQEEKKKMQDELGQLRGESKMAGTRRKALLNQIERYEGRLERAVNAQQTLDQTINELQSKIKTREQVLLARINDLQTQLESGVKQQKPLQGQQLTAKNMTQIVMENMPANKTVGVKPLPISVEDVAATDDIVETQEAGLDVIRLIDDLDSMRQKMREDEARVHYNMGNIFFHQGKYSEAVDEYKKALEISPEDANAHFNLAYVAGDLLNEYQTAIDHYQQYLYLSPGAEDAPLVQEKILEAQLYIHSWADKNVDHAVQNDRPSGLYKW